MSNGHIRKSLNSFIVSFVYGVLKGAKFLYMPSKSLKIERFNTFTCMRKIFVYLFLTPLAL